MKYRLIVTAVLAGGLAFGIAVPAQAAEATCTSVRVLVSASVAGTPAVYGNPSVIAPALDAWVERVLVSAEVAEVSHSIQRAAQYTERVVIDRAYVAAIPAVEELSHVVRHPAVLTTVHHPAVTTTITHPAVTKIVKHAAITTIDYTRYSWTGGKNGPGRGNTPLTAPADWQANGKKYDGSQPGVIHQGNGNASYFYWAAVEVVSTPAWDETVVVTAARDEIVTTSKAWDEVIETSAAWDEKVVDVAATPGTPAVAEVSHIEHDLIREAYEEKVIDVAAQDAVYADIVHASQESVLGEPELISEAVPARDATYEDVADCDGGESGPVIVADPSSTSPTELPLADDTSYANSSETPAALALTGGGVAPIIPLGAGALVAAGLAMLLLRRRNRPAEQD